jgi:hypothetical protein
MTPESFEAGDQMVDHWKALSPEERIQSAPHVLRHLVYELYGDTLSPDQIQELITCLEEGIAGMQSFKRGTESRLRPVELSPDEY